MDDERYMAQAVRAAVPGVYTSPNPRVGAVVVRDGTILHRGSHRGAGSDHAEAEALAGIDATGSTVYVTLEPCAHRGHTPPCTEALIKAGVTRVVVGIEDPDPRVAGRGIAVLREHGIDVTVGVLTRECQALAAPYLHHRRTGRPLVTLKLALSIDGRLAAADGSSRWITGPEARRRVHRRRAEVDAVLVGADTILVDDPRLTVRDVAAARRPIRIVVDASARVPATAAIFRHAGITRGPMRVAEEPARYTSGPRADVMIATTEGVPHDALIAWKEAGAEVLALPRAERGVDLDALITRLGDEGFNEIYCEGGARLASSLLQDDLVDRLEIYRGALMIGDGPHLNLDAGSIEAATRWRPALVESIGDDVLTVYDRNPQEA